MPSESSHPVWKKGCNTGFKTFYGITVEVNKKSCKDEAPSLAISKCFLNN